VVFEVGDAATTTVTEAVALGLERADHVVRVATAFVGVARGGPELAV